MSSGIQVQVPKRGAFEWEERVPSYDVHVRRCVQCGERVDSLILYNRYHRMSGPNVFQEAEHSKVNL